jgi:hypothetical protein
VRANNIFTTTTMSDDQIWKHIGLHGLSVGTFTGMSLAMSWHKATFHLKRSIKECVRAVLMQKPDLSLVSCFSGCQWHFLEIGHSRQQRRCLDLATYPGKAVKGAQWTVFGRSGHVRILKHQEPKTCITNYDSMVSPNDFEKLKDAHRNFMVSP